MKFGVRRLVAAFLVSGAVLFVGGICVHLYLLDGIDGWFFSSGFTEDTEYAPGYSDKAFRKLRIGMSTGDVVALLGPPLEKGQFTASKETWRWSRSPGDRSYRIRVVIVEADRVVQIRSSFYVD